jgi:CheY-like chemotaxis protein
MPAAGRGARLDPCSQLPDFDGFEVARRLAADPAAGLTPLVMLAGRFCS